MDDDANWYEKQNVVRARTHYIYASGALSVLRVSGLLGDDMESATTRPTVVEAPRRRHGGGGGGT